MLDQEKKPFQEFDSFEQFFEQAEQRSGYWIERAKLEFTNDIFSRMKNRGVSKSELASRLEVSPGMVTRLLSGRNNFELATMVRIAIALDCKYLSHLQPLEAKTFWCDVFVVQRPEPFEVWNPVEFSSIQRFFPPMKYLNYEPVPAAA
jgi:transcriptional regulator with XRE-family HTH domain